jgi:hypothetical protein
MGSRNCRPWPFELQWRGRLDLGVKVLGDLQDFWLRSQDPFPSREAVAILLRIFSLGDPQRGDDWRRRARDWISLVDSPDAECKSLSPRAEQVAVDAAVEHLCTIVSAAVASWESRSISEPAVDSVVADMLHQLSADGVVKLYYG